MTKTVLVVEDDEKYQRILTKKLKREGVSVISAINGKVALEKLYLEKVNLILLDLLMPEMSGWSFIYELQKTKKKNIPIIILTNLSSTSFPSDLPYKVDVMVKANVSIDEVIKKIKKRLLI